jgi:hypothetical protein
MSRQTACGKGGRPEEIRQAEATRKPEVYTQVGNSKYEKSTYENETRLIEKENARSKNLNPSREIRDINGTEHLQAFDQTDLKIFQSENSKARKYPEKTDDSIDPGNQNQKTMGEYYADCVATQIYGLESTKFKIPYHGIDNIFIGQDENGQSVITEAKYTVSRNGQSDLVTDIGRRKELSMKWVIDRLEKMTQNDPTTGKCHESYSKENAKLAKKILREIDNEKPIHRLLIHTNVNTLNIIVSECNDNKSENFQVTNAFRRCKN